MAVTQKKMVHSVNVRSWSGRVAIEAVAQRHSNKAIQALVDILQDEDQPAVARIKAAETILAYGYGRPVDRLAVAQINGDSGQDITRLSTRDLIAYAYRLKEPIDTSYQIADDSQSNQPLTTPGIDFETRDE